jgi:hypothetical protein
MTKPPMRNSLAFVAAVPLAALAFSPALAQSTVFTYQGVALGVQWSGDNPGAAVWPFSFIAIGPRQ